MSKKILPRKQLETLKLYSLGIVFRCLKSQEVWTHINYYNSLLYTQVDCIIDNLLQIVNKVILDANTNHNIAFSIAVDYLFPEVKYNNNYNHNNHKSFVL